MTYRLKILYFILSLFFLSEILAAQSFITKTYTVNDGLPDNQVYDVVQDSSGRMWFATHSGVCSYDGEQWEIVGDSTYYVHLEIDKENRVWALPLSAYDSIEVISKYGTIKAFPPIKIKGERRLTCSTFDVFQSDSQSYLAVGTLGNGFFYFQNSSWNHILDKNESANNYITNIIISNKTAYLATFNGIETFDFDTKVVKKFNYKFPASKILSFQIEMLKDKVKRLWVLGEKWIGYIEKNKFYLLSDNIKYYWSGKKDNFFMKLSPSKEEIYYGNGIASFMLKLKIAGDSTFSVNKIITQKAANSFLIDYEGNQWFPTSRGIIKNTKVKFKNFYEKDGLLENEVTAISQLSNQYLVLGHNAGITLMKGSEIKHIKVPGANNESGIITRVLDICRDSQKNVYLTSFTAGVAKINSDLSYTWLKTFDFVSYLSVNIIDNKLLLGTEIGVYRLENMKFDRIWSNLINNEYIRKIVQLKDSTILFANINGVFSLKNNLVKKYQTYIYEGNNVYSIYEQKNDTVLVGTKAGLFYVDSDSLRKFYENDFHIDRPVYFIIEDTKSNLWFGTDNGVFKWDGKNEEHFTTDDGLAGNETNRAAAFVDDEGNLWIGTDKGLSKYSAHQSEEKIVPPRVEFNFIEDVNHNKYFPQSHLFLGENLNNLSFHYHGYSYIDESKNSYEISLINSLYNTTQKFMTKESVVWFNSLQPGNYNFFVRFKNAKGVWSKKSAGISFVVATPFYNRIWFYTSVIFLLSVFLFSTQHKLSELKKIRKKNESTARTSIVLETTENERKRITMDIHDGLGQILASAKMKLEVFNNKKNLDGSELDDAVNLILQAREEISKIINNLHPSEIEKYGLTNAIKIMCSEMNKNTSIKTECIVKNYSKIDKKNFEIMFYRIIQEALTNIIKHSGATYAKIIFDKSATFLSVVIKDDGKGFFFDGFENLNESSMGLINMHERVNSLGGKIFIRSQINSGTIIKIIIPV